MARVSRKKQNLPTPAVDTPIRRWKTALYETASRMTGLPDDKLREHLYDAVELVLVYDTETIEIVWKFNEAKIDTDEIIGVAN